MLPISNEKAKHTVQGRAPMLHPYKKVSYQAPSHLLGRGRKGFTLILVGPSLTVSKSTGLVCLCTYLLTGKTESYKYPISWRINTKKFLFPNRPRESKQVLLFDEAKQLLRLLGIHMDGEAKVPGCRKSWCWSIWRETHLRGHLVICLSSSHNTSKLDSSSQNQNLDRLKPFLPCLVPFYFPPR